MLKTVRGIFRHGQVELKETPTGLEGADVLVTFLTSETAVDLGARGISLEQAGDLRFRLKTFSTDWESPEMEVYDSY